MTATAIKTTDATPTQLRLHRERQERLRRLGITDRLRIPAPQPPQERQEPAPAPEAPPEPAPAAVEQPEPPPPAPSWQAIVKTVCQKHGITKGQLTGRNRQLEIILARHETFYRLYTERGISLPQIGRMLGGFDHTSVLYGIRRHRLRIAGDVIDGRFSISWTPDVRRKAEALRRGGAPMTAIAEELGVSARAVAAAFYRWRTIDAGLAERRERMAQWAEETRAA